MTTSRFPRPLPALLLVSLSASLASAAPMRVAVVGPEEDIGEEARSDVHRLLQDALRESDRRGVLTPAVPLVAVAKCPRPVKPVCLLAAADGAAVLWVQARRTSAELAVALTLIDTSGTVAGPLVLTLSPAMKAPGLVNGAVRKLADALRRAPAAAAVAPPPMTTVAPAPMPSFESAAPTASAAAAGRTAQQGGADWGAIGGWSAVGGLALVAGGVVVGVLARSLNDDLTARHQANALTPDDRANYDRLGTCNVLANTLFVSGGLVTATGLYLWGSANPGGRSGVHLGFTGTF